MVTVSAITQQHQPVSILAAEFPVKLSTFNQLARDMRSSGIQVVGLELAENRIKIDAESVELLSRRFGHELRSMRYSTVGRRTRSTVTIRGVDVVWYSLVKEQDQ
ncbi:hypothetical protein BGP82_00045 [Pseudomonas putida]|uniref:Uncharacterized protein n=1 Tax=Pseudomonas putida TaxID=303 RepID=A0A2S3XBB7_PSEPU|nr:hypothetical protein [Pseudomonas putida]POG12895.1 hypothetical protein BGP82_00045 [Pseudomonas putida]